MGPAARAGTACVFGELGFLSAFLAYADHGVIYRFVPRGVLETEMEVIWLVAGDAREGLDYEIEPLVWLWDVTSRADKRIIERNQAGVAVARLSARPLLADGAGDPGLMERYVAELGGRRWPMTPSSSAAATTA